MHFNICFINLYRSVLLPFTFLFLLIPSILHFFFHFLFSTLIHLLPTYSHLYNSLIIPFSEVDFAANLVMPVVPNVYGLLAPPFVCSLNSWVKLNVRIFHKGKLLML